MYATFNRFEIQMTKKQAISASHPGDCHKDVTALCNTPNIARQLRKIGPELIAAELKDYGAWDENELKDTINNERRIVWIAAGDIAYPQG